MSTSEDKLQKLSEEQIAHLSALKDKLEQIDQLSKEQVYADPVRKIQEEMYQQLLVLREGLYQTVDVACSQATGAPVQASAKPDEKYVSSEEGQKYKEENAKLKYRINILLETIKELESKKQ